MLTIRLALLARRDVLRVVRLMGASEGFVRLPFLIEGLLLTAITSLLALAVIEGGSAFVARNWSDWARLPLSLDAVFVLLALALGLVGSLVGSVGVGSSE